VPHTDAAAFRKAPGPSALRRGKALTRTVSTTCTIGVHPRLSGCWATPSTLTPTFTDNPRVGERSVNDD